MLKRIHIFRASGSGTTTLGRAVAERRRIPFFDTDDYYWKTKYTEARPVAERIELIRRDIDGQEAWLLSGSLCGWGDPLVGNFDGAVFMHLPRDIRMARLREREKGRYGDLILPGGAKHQEYLAFMAWAEQYDNEGFTSRSRTRHETWIHTLPCPVLRLEGALGLDEKTAMLEAWMGA